MKTGEKRCPLNRRLEAVANLVPRGSVAADIGTDHAYLPVRLVQEGICPMAYACDIGEGPLGKARETIDRYGCRGKVLPVLGDGLEALGADRVDTIVIAGMGGDTIAGILARAPWCRGKTLVLQPMTAADRLRRFLWEEGFCLMREKAVEDGGKLYGVMLAVHTGKRRTPGQAETLLGRIAEEPGEEAEAYRAALAARAEKKAEGLLRAGRERESGEWKSMAEQMRKPLPTAEDLRRALDRLAPYDTAESWDNSGLLVGDPEGRVERVLLALDVSLPVIEEAEERGAGMILTHHPVIFRPLKRLTAGSLPWELARRGLTALCAHTNLDAAPGGVGDALAKALGLVDIAPCIPGERGMLGRIGRVKDGPVTAAWLAKQAKERLGAAECRCALLPKPVEKVALVSGDGGGYLREALEAGADLLLTGEAGHHDFWLARELGISLAALGHYETERVVLPVLKEWLGERFPQVKFVISQRDGSPIELL